MRLPSNRLGIYTWFLALLVLGLMAMPAVLDTVQTVDEGVWEGAVDLESPVLTPIAETLDLVGGVVAMAVFTVVVAGVLWSRKRQISALVWTSAMVLGQALSWALKLAYERPRPDMPLHAESTWSFPSGHALAAAVVAAGLFYLLNGGLVARFAAWLWVLAMAASRVYLRVHWLSDVVVGALLGFAVVVGLLLLTSRRLEAEQLAYSSSSEAAAGT